MFSVNCVILCCQVPGNMIQVLLSKIRAVKKTFGEQVNQVLRRYGVPKLVDKDG